MLQSELFVVDRTFALTVFLLIIEPFLFFYFFIYFFLKRDCVDRTFELRNPGNYRRARELS